MIEPKLQARTRRNHPLPRLSCEHVQQGFMVAARVIREDVMIEVCRNCYTRQHLLKTTVDGKVVSL